MTFYFFGILFCFEFFPFLTATYRRLHDIGKSESFIGIFFIPYVGIIIFIVFLCKDSVMEQNQYGPCPKYEISDDTNEQVNYQNCQIPIQSNDEQNDTPQNYNPPEYNYNTNPDTPNPIEETPSQSYEPPNYLTPSKE